MTRILALALAIASCALAPLMALWSAIVFGGWAIGLTDTSRALRIALGWDQLLNTPTGGSEDETVSSRAARARDEGRRWGCVLCRLLDRLDADHCNNAKGS